MTKVMIPVDTILYGVCEAYCMGRSFLWRIFFGWRKTKATKKNGEWAYYVLPNRDYERLRLLATDIEVNLNI